MEKIQQYYKLAAIKPEYSILHKPYFRPSAKKIILNGKELELFYVAEFDSYVPNIEAAKKGGGEKNILILEY
jgi:hypothetical protein